MFFALWKVDTLLFAGKCRLFILVHPTRLPRIRGGLWALPKRLANYAPNVLSIYYILLFFLWYPLIVILAVRFDPCGYSKAPAIAGALVHPTRFELATLRIGIWYSIQLSYGCLPFCSINNRIAVIRRPIFRPDGKAYVFRRQNNTCSPIRLNMIPLQRKKSKSFRYAILKRYFR